MSLQETLRAASARNTALLATLAATDHAEPALVELERHIEDLTDSLACQTKLLGDLEAKRKAEHREHVEYRDSIVRRFAYKVARKQERFEEKASKEEQDYLHAIQAERSATEEKEALQRLLDEARQRREHLHSETRQHDDAQRELDALYHGIFRGATPGFPDEDVQERKTDTALAAYQETRRRYELDNQVHGLLLGALQRMQESGKYMADARQSSRMDMFGGGSMADMLERSSLHSAEKASIEAQLLLVQARMLDPAHVPEVPRPQIAQGSVMSDVLFDNIFTDMDFHDKIKRSQTEVETCAAAIKALMEDATQRRFFAQTEAQQAEATLQSARSELQKVRQDIFARAASATS
ncbi:uncharacterized protein PFL1_06039 [Pseudozyma flocculosa PF-1]|uniref:Uncharacterized protein n=2 Tax=Pseudozyma flocculosa TaxID=84751 RepID=A0A5C3F5T0_9BASI|nr:uncharacterized protein PFL1_06039 [Pseudozyma flocculosa PF-1]EPQ26391.1 hypothetical protein PFL1_06039 [Pseudozyma flocculosa PF-1]SPO39017.1 uncharacterized protein PSFLO_04496 [Pseudozyma flocculosa]